jgi:hypothetical protein
MLPVLLSEDEGQAKRRLHMASHKSNNSSKG